MATAQELEEASDFLDEQAKARKDSDNDIEALLKILGGSLLSSPNMKL